MKKFAIIFAGCMALSLISCGSTSNAVSRYEEGADVKDITGYWNENDIKLVCEKLISGCIASPRVANFKALNGRDPVAIVGKISNKSSEHIDTAMVAKRFQTAIINSGVMEFVADSEQRLALREEKVDQAENAYDTAKSIGNELAADYMLQGTVYSHVDEEGLESVRTYQVDAQLIDIESNKILWQDEKTISKYIKKSAKKL
ncbi:MAG: penicillin-binding protein activator LpoB [Treponema sp.]|uniref:penicillin-binding protein activator LpoB n=1 Tax=Treponema sp. TaxID=166 RepID=UPI001B42065A|nr:penicillin-binding protein activator LpoB [Treponema sp.]MBP3771643.1 penicillin-binding protein activator LpoB [Treponema sp.]MBQ9282794.1 penicillin-binding protein activator LpoB [Treponema sp.]